MFAIISCLPQFYTQSRHISRRYATILWCTIDPWDCGLALRPAR